MATSKSQFSSGSNEGDAQNASGEQCQPPSEGTPQSQKSIIEEMQIADIVSDQDLQSRVQVSAEAIDEYAELLTEGTQFPPIDVYRIEDEHFVVDGFTRLEAAKKAGKETILVNVHEGNRRDAIEFSLQANGRHGKPRTNADKRRVVTYALKDECYATWSDGRIARLCAVSQPFVSKVRCELAQNGIDSPDVRETATGRRINTARIGRRRARPNSVGSDPEEPIEEASVPIREATPDAEAGYETGNPHAISDAVHASHSNQSDQPPDDDDEDSVREEASEDTPRDHSSETHQEETETNVEQVPEVSVEHLQERILKLDALLAERDARIKELEAELKEVKEENEKLQIAQEIRLDALAAILEPEVDEGIHPDNLIPSKD